MSPPPRHVPAGEHIVLGVRSPRLEAIDDVVLGGEIFNKPRAREMTQLAEAVDSRDPAVGLAAVASLRRLVDELEALHVANARHCRWSWQAIAEVLGVTRQSVHKKHRADGRRPRG
jgi:hypothetical protein